MHRFYSFIQTAKKQYSGKVCEKSKIELEDQKMPTTTTKTDRQTETGLCYQHEQPRICGAWEEGVSTAIWQAHPSSVHDPSGRR